MKRRQSVLFLILTLFLLSGCNIFQFTSSPTSANDYIASGRAKINDGDYSGALSDFANAMEEDNFNSQARYLHAKASLLVSGFNVINVITEMSDTSRMNDTTMIALPFFNWDLADANSMYRANIVIHEDLEPIRLGETHGPIVYEDIMHDYTLAVLIEGILSLRDTNGDLYIDDTDFNLNFLWMDGELNMENLLDFWNSLDGLTDEQRVDIINNLIGNGVDLLDIPLLLFPDLFGEENPYDFAELDSLTNNIQNGLEIFLINDGIDNDGDSFDTNGDGLPTPLIWNDFNLNGLIENASGNPFPANYSGPYSGEFVGGDWGVDEELLDSIDNDGDSIIDEDSHL
ncbi:MAG: hypothetical protein ISR91_03005 [Candidatus Delongbacteria bacterium]|nr:hypothetical protein [bacterium]MBL7033090.1 hypothetical protein [Candidatus Delongbacteria bacterium]